MSDGIWTAASLAAKLDGVEYPLYKWPTFETLRREAKSAGLLIVYGASDDLMEFEGLFRDEAGVYGSKDVVLDASGIVPDRDDIEDDEDMARYLAGKERGHVIKAIWDRGDGVSWAYETALPHSTFKVMEDGEVYCIGLVIDGVSLGASV